MDGGRIALGLYALYLALAFGLRTLIQIRRTGDSGFRKLSARVGSLEWLAGVGFTVAVVAGAVAAWLDANGTLDPVGALDSDAVRVAGIAIFAVGLLGTLYAQLAMGASWRVGVDPGERTDLVTDGPFRLVRNPIFSAMLPATAGLALLVPNVLALGALVALFVALEIQVRLVEEPYLLRTHGAAYRDYAGRVGRFVPGLGRLAR